MSVLDCFILPSESVIVKEHKNEKDILWRWYVKVDYAYIKISKQLKDEIGRGIFPEDERFPSEYQFAKRFDVSLPIIREVFQRLFKEKLLVEKHGLGVFVNPKPLFTAGIEELTSVSEMVRQAGMEPGTIFLDFSETVVTAEEALKFNCEPDEKLMTIKRIRTADNQPVVFCIDQVLTKNYSGRAEELLRMSIFDAIEDSGSIRIDQAVANIIPVAYDEEASSILRCGIDVPLLELEQKHYSEEGDMVLYSENFFRADKFSFHVNRKRV